MKKRISYLCILVTAFVFSLMEITLKVASQQVVGLNGIQISFWRFLIALLSFSPIMIAQIRTKKIHFTTADWQFFGLNGAIFIVICMSAYQISCKLEPAAIAAILFSCNPVFVLLFTKLILKKRLLKSEICLITFAISGLLLIINPRNLKIFLNWRGVLISLLSACTFGLYTVLSKKYLSHQKSSSFIVAGMSFFCGSVELFILILCSHLSEIAEFLYRTKNLQMLANIPIIAGIDYHNISLLLFIGIVITTLGYGCYFYAVEQLGAFKASTSFLIKAILSPIFAIIFLHETLNITSITGIILIIIGLAFPFFTKKEV